MISRLVPMPSIARAELHQEARQVLHVGLARRRSSRRCGPGAVTAAISAFSVAVTDASSRKMSAPLSPEWLSL